VEDEKDNRSSKANASETSGRETVVVPVVAEEVVIGSNVETERVRIIKSVRTRDEDVETYADREDFEVERVPVGKVVTTPPAIRVEGDTTIIPVLEEIVVLEKRLVVKEEVRVRKHRTRERRQFHVQLRTEHVEVERSAANADSSEETRRTRRTHP
jgi:uncharacterized protein (TIGR02271 family)